MGKAKSKKRRILKSFLIAFGTIIIVVLALIGWIALRLFSGPDLMEISEFHPFRSEKLKEQYLDLYETRAKEWPVASETKTVETSFGKTFVRISGPVGAPPLVLLPGGGSNSLLWIPNIEALSKDFRTYALDNIYDLGLSVYTQPFKSSEEFVKWLDELFTILGLGDDINLMGLSYGGWITSQYALSIPNRLDKVVLLAPAATIVPFDSEFMKRMILSIMPFRYFFKKTIYWTWEDAVNKDERSHRFVDKHVDITYLGLRSFKLKSPPNPTVLQDEELQSVQVPTLFLVGENEKIYSAQEAVQRLNGTAPQIKTEIIPNCGHDLTIVQTEMVNEKILQFLKQP